MRLFKHLSPVTQRPGHAQISNFQIKLEFTTAVIDRLLLADRQSAWKIVPGAGTDTTDTGTDTGTDVTGIYY
ncbi:MAG TPA: hypothetical protein PLL36_03600 [Candidatus Hydrogenedentes bacterium]|jgi:hypothetical protein|nr:MAG: hypothetical protein BWX80_02167 [Candidatus Hydrogenedentes bacterium ADurb.Bin101]HOC68947.1 hypothetical protein [Candidatus Hydrogenedentota bacterium]HQN00131.1 hypothetical protein [Candidatus Hydrogenedentota bacterium]